MAGPLLAAGSVIDVGMKLIDRFFPSKTDQDNAKLKLLEMQQQGEFKWIETMKASDTAQAAVNAEEAKSESLFKSGWRPFIGWVCGTSFAYQMVIRPLSSWLSVNYFQLEPLPPLDMESLVTILFGMLGLGAYRTYEKVKDAD
jgi:hypothetical protein